VILNWLPLSITHSGHTAQSLQSQRVPPMMVLSPALHAV